MLVGPSLRPARFSRFSTRSVPKAAILLGGRKKFVMVGCVTYALYQNPPHPGGGVDPHSDVARLPVAPPGAAQPIEPSHSGGEHAVGEEAALGIHGSCWTNSRGGGTHGQDEANLILPRYVCFLTHDLGPLQSSESLAYLFLLPCP